MVRRKNEKREKKKTRWGQGSTSRKKQKKEGRKRVKGGKGGVIQVLSAEIKRESRVTNREKQLQGKKTKRSTERK